MSADPRFLDTWLASRPAPKASGSLQVRLDAPSGITYAPDQTDPHTASRRLFAVPKLPEPPELLYDFEDEIIGYERATRREPTFVLGDEDTDAMTPAQMLAAEYRDKEPVKQDVQRDETRVAKDHASADEQTDTRVGAATATSSKTDEPEALAERVRDVHLAPSNADELPTDAEDVERGGFAFSTDDADENATENVWESVLRSRESSAAPPSVSDKASETKDTMPAADDADAKSHSTSASHEPAFAEALEEQDTEDAKDTKGSEESKESKATKQPEGPADQPPDAEASTEAKDAAKQPEETAEKPSKAAKKKAKKQAKKAAKKAQSGDDPETDQAAAEAQGKADNDAEPVEEPKPTPKAEAEPEREANAEPEAKADSEVAADAESKANAEPKAEVEPKADAEPKAEVEPKAEAESNSVTKAAPEDAQAGDVPEPRAEPVCEAGADDTKTVAFADAVSEHTVDTWTMPKKHHIPIADTASIRTAQSHAASLAPSTAPTISQMTLLSNMKHDRPEAMPKPVRTNFREYKYQPPPSQSNPKFGTHVWDAPKYNTLRSTETLAQQPIGMDAGSQWERVSGYGQARPAAHDSAAQTSLETVRALFVPDPRSWHPYRFVRRTDPRQVLLFAAGSSLTGAQVQAVQAAKRAADGSGKVSEEKLRSLASHFGTTENTKVQGGIGVVYSPTASLCAALGESFDAARAEKNVSRRLERPEFPNRTTTQRAALRSVIAALEYVHWEKEGFDKVVIAVHNAWIVRGISHDIWTWRQNGWVLTRETPQGMPGESVPNRDLWELLDYLVRQWEDVEYVIPLTPAATVGSGICPNRPTARPCTSQSRVRYVPNL